MVHFCIVMIITHQYNGAFFIIKAKFINNNGVISNKNCAKISHNNIS